MERNTAGEAAYGGASQPHASPVEWVGPWRANLEIARNPSPWNRPLEAAVVLRGGSTDRRVQRIRVRLEQYVAEPAEHLCIATIETAQDAWVGARRGLRVPISFSVETLLGCKLHAARTSLSASIIPDGDVGGSVWAFTTLVPPPECTAVTDAVSEILGGVPVRWAGFEQGSVSAHLVPRGELKEWLDEVRLTWPRAHDPSDVEITVDRAERTAADVVRALVGDDRRRSSLRLESSGPGLVRERVAELLRAFLPRPAGLRDLPIPGAPSRAAEQALPRPSAAGPNPSAGTRVEHPEA